MNNVEYYYHKHTIDMKYFSYYFRQSYPSKYVPPNATLTSKDIMSLITASF